MVPQFYLHDVRAHLDEEVAGSGCLAEATVAQVFLNSQPGSTPAGDTSPPVVSPSTCARPSVGQQEQLWPPMAMPAVIFSN